MATLTVTNPELYSGPVMQVTEDFYILNGQSWKAGQLLYVDTSGLIKACASDSVAIKFLALETVTDPGNSTTTCKLGIIHKDHVFRMNELDGTVSKAALGQKYALDVSDNVCTVDADDTDHDAFIVTGIASDDNPIQDTTSDTKGRLYVKVIATVIQADPA